MIQEESECLYKKFSVYIRKTIWFSRSDYLKRQWLRERNESHAQDIEEQADPQQSCNLSVSLEESSLLEICPDEKLYYAVRTLTALESHVLYESIICGKGTNEIALEQNKSYYSIMKSKQRGLDKLRRVVKGEDDEIV